MILFKTFAEIPLDFMDRFSLKKVITYNLNSYINIGNQLNNLNPSYLNYEGPYDEVEFDALYSNFIISDNNAFMELMMPLMDYYNNPELLVQILISRSPYRDCITENIMKVIQQRYGLNTYLVNTMEDLYAIIEEPDFSIDGLNRLNQDIERYSAFVGSITGELYKSADN